MRRAPATIAAIAVAGVAAIALETFVLGWWSELACGGDTDGCGSSSGLTSALLAVALVGGGVSCAVVIADAVRCARRDASAIGTLVRTIAIAACALLGVWIVAAVVGRSLA